MNKLYILGALALSAQAGWVGTSATTITSLTSVGSYTYTVSGDCYSALTTGTTLGIFNTYK
jgi:hypothetical protein